MRDPEEIEERLEEFLRAQESVVFKYDTERRQILIIGWTNALAWALERELVA